MAAAAGAAAQSRGVAFGGGCGGSGMAAAASESLHPPRQQQQGATERHAACASKRKNTGVVGIPLCRQSPFGFLVARDVIRLRGWCNAPCSHLLSAGPHLQTHQLRLLAASAARSLSCVISNTP